MGKRFIYLKIFSSSGSVCMRIIPSFTKVTIAIALIGTLSSCYRAGPNFHALPAPAVKTYTESPQLSKTVRADSVAQSFQLGQETPSKWWTVFHSPAINQLVETGLANNPNFAAAQATLRQAQANFAAEQGGTLLPQVDAQLGDSRTKAFPLGTTATKTALYTTYNASVNVSYTFDLFGANQRQLESLAAQVDYQNYLLQASYLTITTNIVTTAIAVASTQAQIEATQALIQAERKQLTIMQKQLQLGGIAQTALLAEQTQVAQTEATLPALNKTLAQSRSALAILVGALPGNATLPTLKLTDLTLPASLPLKIPSVLVEKRPDIQASQALVHAASANLGVATAHLFPQLTLSANYSWEAAAPSGLFSPASNIWGITTGLTQPIFHGGALRAQRKAAVAGLDQATAQYRQTVLQAFKDVADTLKALENDALSVQAQERAAFAAEHTWRISQKQLQLGGVSILTALNAQQQYEQALMNKIQAQGLRFSDTAALFQAMGG